MKNRVARHSNSINEMIHNNDKENSTSNDTNKTATSGTAYPSVMFLNELTRARKNRRYILFTGIFFGVDKNEMLCYTPMNLTS